MTKKPSLLRQTLIGRFKHEIQKERAIEQIRNFLFQLNISKAEALHQKGRKKMENSTPNLSPTVKRRNQEGKTSVLFICRRGSRNQNPNREASAEETRSWCGDRRSIHRKRQNPIPYRESESLRAKKSRERGETESA